MSHSIPIFLFLLDPTAVPSPLASWRDAAELIETRWNQREQQGQTGETGDFVASTSRNWWHQHLLYLLCHAYGIRGLDFAAQEVARLEKPELEAAASALDELFRLLAARRLPEDWSALQPYADVLGPQLLPAMRQARASALIGPSDLGFDAALSFFAYLKSLRGMVRAAARHNKSLLLVMPDFNDLYGGLGPAR